MRAYFFTNMYIAGIHAGIQAQHCTTELFVKYTRTSLAKKTLYAWAASYKTTLILNGQDSRSMKQILTQLQLFSRLLHLPMATFHEEGIENSMTCIGIVVPSQVYDAYPKSVTEERLLSLIRRFQLAR